MDKILFYTCVILFVIFILPKVCRIIRTEYYVSKIDGRDYVSSDIETANTLAMLHRDNKKLIKYMKKKYKNTEFESNVLFLEKNYKKNGGGNLRENYYPSPDDTSYTTNKGEVIAICLRNPKSDKIYNYNTLMFVNLHELSHLTDRQIGHNSSFWDTFKTVLTNAVELGIYKSEDYNTNPIEYCGIEISDQPYLN